MSGLFKNLGFSSTSRKMLFWGICIWVRLAIAYLVWNDFIPNSYVRGAGLVGIYMNYTGLNDNVWWSRGFHLITSMILASGIVNSGAILALDVFGGIVTALWRM